jgi:hypothetical protein
MNINFDLGINQLKMMQKFFRRVIAAKAVTINSLNLGTILSVYIALSACIADSSFFESCFAQTQNTEKFAAVESNNDSKGTEQSESPYHSNNLMQTKFLGTASCASSNCHGHSAPVKGASVRLNEYLTWFKHDSHSRAYNILLNEQSKKIAYNLNIPAAEKDPTCLSCHATWVADENQRGEKYRLNDGVSCESCHGAAEKWISSHTDPKASYEDHISKGLSDLKDTETKTRLCLSCHLGNDVQNITHRIMGAGHPRLTFEADTFESVMPRHWNYENYSASSNWLLSQSVQAVERSKALYSPKRSKDGVFPEFTTMTCYSCHHDLNDNLYKDRDYSGRPGLVHLNSAELWVISKALEAIEPKVAQKLKQNLDSLQAKFGKEDISTLAKETVKLINDEVLPKIRNRSLSSEEQAKIFKLLTSSEHKNLQYETAEQIAMAAAVIASENPDKQQYRSKAKELYKALDRPGKVNTLPFHP